MFCLQHNTNMTKFSRCHHRPQAGCRLTFALLVGLAVAAIGTSVPGGGTVAAQGLQPCGLLTTDEIEALAPNEEVSEGTSSAFEALDSFTCRYTWGSGVDRFTLAVYVNPASRAYAGMSAETIKSSLLSSVTPGTADATIPDVGEAAVFKSYSSVHVSASAYAKGRLLQVNLDGIDARDRKDRLISLLKSAASRL
jgi:hypothetical protein